MVFCAAGGMVGCICMVASVVNFFQGIVAAKLRRVDCPLDMGVCPW